MYIILFCVLFNSLSSAFDSDLSFLQVHMKLFTLSYIAHAQNWTSEGVDRNILESTGITKVSVLSREICLAKNKVSLRASKNVYPRSN